MSSRNSWWGRTLRILGIVLLSLTAAFTLMGGAGTTCVALNPTGFGGKFSGIAPFQWLYIVFVLVTLAIGAWGVRAVVRLVNGTKGSYGGALLVLVAGILVGGIHMGASRMLRGGSMPVDMVVYTTALTLAVFLIFRIPGVWQAIHFEQPRAPGKPNKAATAAALIATGMLTLTVQFMMAPTHTVDGVNYADVWHRTLTVLGTALAVAGVVSPVVSRSRTHRSFRAETEPAG